MTAVVQGAAHIVRRFPDHDRYIDGDYTAKHPELYWHPVGTLWQRVADRDR